MNFSENSTTQIATNHLGTLDTNIMAVLYTLFGIIGLLGNVSVVIIICTSRTYRCSFSSLFLVNLAIADSLVCLTATPYYVVSLAMKVHIPDDHDPFTSEHNSICKLPMFLNFFTASLRALSLTVMSSDRYIAINHPYFYAHHCAFEVGKARGIFVMIYVWLQSFVTIIPPIANGSLMAVVFYGSNGRLCGIVWSRSNFAFYAIIMAINFILPAIIILFTNCKVFWLARNHVVREKIKKRHVGKSYGITSLAPSIHSFDMIRRRILKRCARVSIQVITSKEEKSPRTPRHKNNSTATTSTAASNLRVSRADNSEQRRLSGPAKMLDHEWSSINLTPNAPDMPMNNMLRLEREITSSKTIENSRPSSTSKIKQSTAAGRTSSEWEVALSTLALVIFYFISYLPFLITRLVEANSKRTISIELVAYTTLLTTLGSCINPVIVFKTRKEYKRILKQKLCKRRNAVESFPSFYSSSRALPGM